MRIAVQTTVAFAAALIGGAPLSAWSQAARILGETDGVTQNTTTIAPSAGPIVSPVHKKTGDLARTAREAAQAAVAAPAIAKSTAAPIPASDAAEPAAGTAGTTAPQGNQPAGSVTDTPSTHVPGVIPNQGTTLKVRARVRTLRA